MPELKIPEGGCSFLIDSDAASMDGDHDKAELASLRSCSPKTAASSSLYTTDDLGSVVSDGQESDYASGDRSAAAALLELEEAGVCGLEEELEASLALVEDRAEELMRQGADMRHVLCTSWKLQPKMAVGMRLRKGSATTVASGGGRGGQQTLREAALAQKKAIIQVEYERYSTSRNSINNRNSRATVRRPPPGFERRLSNNSFEAPLVGDLYRREASPPVNCNNNSGTSGLTPILVSYADGSNTLSLAAEPMVLHDLTVSCVADTCHIFLTQMKNPTYVGLEPLEAAMAEAYCGGFEEAAVVGSSSAAPPPMLLRPIAAGSLLAVFSDEKWYRCQVVAYHPEADTCDIKFVDHGGYTTVSVDELRPLRSDFVRLPFQAVEVYVAAIRAATDEIMIDITADLLFRREISLQLLGYASDGVPVVQIYFYQEDYIHLLSQEILEDCYQTYLRAHPGHVVVAPCKAYALEEEEEEEEGSTCCSEEAGAAGGDESGIGTGSEGEEEEEQQQQFQQTEQEEQQHSDWSQQVENWNEADSTLAVGHQHTDFVEEEFADATTAAAAAFVPAYPTLFVPPEAALAQPAAAYYLPEQAPCLPVLYYVADPNGAPCYYPVVAAPVAPLFVAPHPYLEAECYSHYEQQIGEQQEVEEDQSCHTEVEAEQADNSQDEVVVPAQQYKETFDCVGSTIAELLNKPFEEWSQEDYEQYYQFEEQQQQLLSCH